MDYLTNVIKETLGLVNEMSPYLLLGFLLAGLMHEFVPSSIYHKYMSKSNLGSVLVSALFGIPLPLCSCGVIPTAMGIRREGASRGATISFLIATPQTGVDSIVATYSLMGLPFAIIRPIVALVTAIFGGLLCNVFETDDEVIVARKPQHDHDEEEEEHEPLLHRLREALEYAYVEMMEDIGKWLLIGLVIAGIITSIVPDEWFSIFQDNSLYSILFVLLFSIPMYLCATGSIPIAVALMMKGLTPGAALVLLMAGPASNAASILVINKVLGRRTLILYLLSIVSGAIVFGLGIDMLLPRQWFMTDLITQGGCCSEHMGWFSYACTALLMLLIGNALSPRKLWGTHCCCCHCHDEEHDHCHACNDDELGCEATEPAFTLYNIEGMRCNHCAANTQKAIASVEGVTEAIVDLASGTAHVTGQHQEADVVAAVESLGFKVTCTKR